MRTQAQKNKILRQFSLSLLTKIIRIVLRLLRNGILARVLGPADRGVFSLIISLPVLIMTVGNCGIANSSAYQVANATSSPRRLFRNINFTLFAIGAALLLVSLFWVQQDWLVKDEVEKILCYRWHIAFATVLVMYSVVNFNLLNVLHRIVRYNLFSLFESLLPLLFFVILWWSFGVAPLLAAVYSWFGSLVVIAILTCQGRGNCMKMRFDLDVQKELFRYGGRSYFDTLFAKLLLRIDFLFVSAMVGAEGLGYYAMATAAAELLLVVPESLGISLFSFLYKKGGLDKDATVATVLRLLFWAMIILALLFAVFGKILILFLFGRDYFPAYMPLLLLLPGLVALGYSTPVRLALLGEDRPGTVSIITGTSLGLNIVFNLIFIPVWGISGAAIASSITYGFGAVALSVVFLRWFNLGLRDILLVRFADIRELAELLKGQM